MALTLKSLLSHINFAHSRSPDFRLVCGIDDALKSTESTTLFGITSDEHIHTI